MDNIIWDGILDKTIKWNKEGTSNAKIYNLSGDIRIFVF